MLLFLLLLAGVRFIRLLQNNVTAKRLNN